MSALVQFVKQFENATLTTIIYKDKPWWIAREVGAALGYSANGKRLVDKVTEGWAEDFTAADRWTVEGEELKQIQEMMRGTDSVPLGQGSLMLLSESGVNKVILLSRKPEGRRLRDWLAKEVLPEISRTGKYDSTPAVSQRPGSVDGLLESTRLLLASVEAMAAQEKRLAVVEQHIERIEAQRAVATSEMFATERADEKPAEVTPRMKVVRLHRAFCTATGADFRDTWNWLYREFRDRYHFDAKVRAENRKCSTLDVIEQEGLMGALYVLASDLFVARGVA